MGHQVTVLCGGNGELVEKLRSSSIRVVNIPMFGRDFSWLSDLQSLFFIIKTVARERPDVFHINSAKMGGAGIFAGRLLRVPKIIFTAHGWAFNENRSWISKIFIKFLSWLTILGSHQTIAVSEKTRRDISNWPFIKSKIIVIKNGISKFELIERTNQTFTVGTIAELHHIKGLDVLLKAWSRFVDKHRDVRLVIIGDGEEKQNLFNLAQSLGISSSVSFEGFVENAKSHLSLFDIFVLPSRSEAMPYALLEAGVASLPVIACAVGGIPEVIEHGKSGLLIKPNNPDELTESLDKLKENESLRKELGERLHEKVIKDFSVEKMVRDTLKLYV